ncbi:type II toxin-antitoxin system RelE/ParE family toxin [Methylobacterium sp. ARG-1]|uniref:type II toxin-antitoxin system RelE/ParE family toxin n=1 Tax=Methylobacterium sp. ARG-1 TaxID=1692501 RepID=UPI000680C501|nr:type II toxin-antitoxin system RelE/ParE family toxin [Methylobacterium sp. ARG-1]KNY23329.1 plasmid stabilization protein [Methylobacterium sp. ARG-1]
MIVRFTEEAERNLESIGDYIARTNPFRALSFVQSLRSKCMGLADLPNGFPVVPRYEKQEIRRRVYANYVFVYRVETDRIVILHVLNGAMDYDVIPFPP